MFLSSKKDIVQTKWVFDYGLLSLNHIFTTKVWFLIKLYKILKLNENDGNLLLRDSTKDT